MLDKADRLYRQLQNNRPTLEALLVRISERSIHVQVLYATSNRSTYCFIHVHVCRTVHMYLYCLYMYMHTFA